MKGTRLLAFSFSAAALFAASSAKADIETLGNARPRGGPIGLGVILGDPSGFSAKYFFTPTSAVDMAFGWGFQGDGSGQVHADYLFHPHILHASDVVRVAWYFGAGGALNFYDDGVDIGLRVPLGLSYALQTVAIDPFLEIAPGANFTDPSFRFDMAIGIRYYF